MTAKYKKSLSFFLLCLASKSLTSLLPCVSPSLLHGEAGAVDAGAIGRGIAADARRWVLLLPSPRGGESTLMPAPQGEGRCWCRRHNRERALLMPTPWEGRAVDASGKGRGIVANAGGIWRGIATNAGSMWRGIAADAGATIGGGRCWYGQHGEGDCHQCRHHDRVRALSIPAPQEGHAVDAGGMLRGIAADAGTTGRGRCWCQQNEARDLRQCRRHGALSMPAPQGGGYRCCRRHGDGDHSQWRRH